MVCDALAAARAIEKLADCGPLSHEIATARSSGAQEHQISLFFEVPFPQTTIWRAQARALAPRSTSQEEQRFPSVHASFEFSHSQGHEQNCAILG